MHEGGLSGRKYIGVVFEINNLSYFAPLSSFKSKYKKMKESVDFNRQKSRIRKNAEIVYNHKKRNGNLTPLAKRTNDFEMLEKLSRDFSDS